MWRWTQVGFLAAASHDLRQPLQILIGLHDLLERQIEDNEARRLVARIGAVLDSMSRTLNTFLEIDRLEAGALRLQLTDLPVNEILGKFHAKFAEEAIARGLVWRFVPCRLAVRSV